MLQRIFLRKASFLANQNHKGDAFKCILRNARHAVRNTNDQGIAAIGKCPCRNSCYRIRDNNLLECSAARESFCANLMNIAGQQAAAVSISYAISESLS